MINTVNWKCWFKHDWEVWQSKGTARGVFLELILLGLVIVGASNLVGIPPQVILFSLVTYGVFRVFMAMDTYSFKKLYSHVAYSSVSAYNTLNKGLLQDCDKTCVRCNKMIFTFSKSKRRHDEKQRKKDIKTQQRIQQRNNAYISYQQQHKALASEEK